MAVGTGGQGEGQSPPPNILPTKNLKSKNKTYTSVYINKAKIGSKLIGFGKSHIY